MTDVTSIEILRDRFSVLVDRFWHLIASQAGYLGGNANGFKMKLDAGSDYYFLENVVVAGIGYRTVLSRNAKDIVMFEVQGPYYAEWKRKRDYILFFTHYAWLSRQSR